MIMGYLKDRHGVRLLGATPPGTCPECAIKHDPDMPHNFQSLVYQYKYYDRHGRWPTWADAMAHCLPETKALWCEALKERGIEVNPEAGVAVEEAEIEIPIQLKEAND
jgi:hypothetical protein